jgi:hypothetical protein
MRRRSRLYAFTLPYLALTLTGSSLFGQDTTRTRPDGTTPAVDTQPAARQPARTPSLPFEFSGILFANYQYGGVKGNRTTNRFDLDRAYLTFRATPGEHFGIRITADVFQQRDTTRDSYYRGWTMRAKYAYGQFDFIRGTGDALKANVRLGILPTVVIEHEEQHWQRGLSTVALEQQGFFSSADAGAALNMILPNKRGEIYATVTNGPGYTSRETDRFKEYALRLTLTPLASSSGFLKGLSVSPWYSFGERASDFARRRGTVAAVSDGLRKDRGGIFVGIRDPRIIFGAELAQRWDVIESADTARDTAPTQVDRSLRVLSLHATVRPLTSIASVPAWPLAVVVRVDHVKPDVDSDAYFRNYIAGLQWEFNRRTSLTFDYQNAAPRDGGTGTDNKVFFLHLIAGF